MSIVADLDKLRAWAAREICPKVQLKLPDDNANDARYNWKLVTPEAFVMYVPTRDRLPPRVAAPIPSICVQLVEGEHSLASSSGRFEIRLCLSAWNPGEHGNDIFQPTARPDGTISYQQWIGPEARAHFIRGAEGWRDVWGFVDTALATLESTEFIEGMRIVKENGIKFGPFTEERGIVDYYPYWFAWITCTFEHALPRRTPEAYQDFL